MSDKYSKTALSSGSSWSLFAENTAFEESDAVVEKLGKAAETTRLHAIDLNKFQQCPAREFLQLAVCKQCHKLLILSSMQRHYELKHSKFLSSVKPSPPKRCTPPTLYSPTTTYSKSKVLKASNKFIRIEEVDPNEANVKIEEVPLTIPQFNSAAKIKLPKINIKKLTSESKKGNAGKVGSPVSSPQICIEVKGNIKKIPHLKEKEYDVDKHCGVWIPEMERNCTRSLTCKTHPLSLRRQVPGRSKDFDVLLAEHRQRVALKAQDNASNASSSPQSNSRGGTPVNSPYGFDKIVFPAVPVPSATNYHKDQASSNMKSPKSASLKTLAEESQQSNGFSQVFVDYISDDVLGSSNLPTISFHPRPIKLDNFGGRQTDCRCRLFSRRMDHFRNAASSMLDRYTNASYMSVKQSVKDPIRAGQDDIRPALQDPLQNGIIHKQKGRTSKIGGMKRQLSHDTQQGIIADPLSYAASSKRRHSSELPVVDPFALNNQPNFNRSLSNPPQANQQFVKVKEFQKPNTDSNSLPSHRAKSTNEYLVNNIDGTTTNYIITTTVSNVLPGNFISTSGTVSVNLNSSLNLCQSLGIAPSNNDAHHRQNSVDSTYSSTSSNKITAAPNVTITQGMIVSLPTAVLQNNQQSAYTIGSQIKDLISHSSPSRTVQQVAVSSSSLALKQGFQSFCFTLVVQIFGRDGNSHVYNYVSGTAGTLVIFSVINSGHRFDDLAMSQNGSNLHLNELLRCKYLAKQEIS